MAYIPIDNVGQYGVIKDVRPHLLPPNAWSSAENVRFDDGSAWKVEGYSAVYDPPGVAPRNLFFLRDATTNYWVQGGLAKVFVHNEATHTDITRTTGGDYNVDAALGWNGGILSGILIMNNGTDVPQMWNPLSITQPLQALSNWTAGMTAKVVRPYKQFLIALDVTKSGTNYPYLVKWSHPAEPGSVPTSWDETVTTNDAGEYDLGESEDHLVDCLQLADRNIIYKENSAYMQSFIGHPFIFKFDAIQNISGIFSQDCVVQYRFGQHCVLTQDDMIIHAGSNPESIFDQRYRRWFFNNVDSSNYASTFLIHHVSDKEIWLCFPENGAVYPTLALVWNYRENSWGVRELPGICDIELGIPPVPTNISWDGGTSTSWDTVDGKPWGFTTRVQTLKVPVFADIVNTKIYEANQGNTANGTNYTALLERQGLAIEQLRDGSLTQNFESWKFLRGIRPRIQADAGTSISVYVGTQKHITDTVVWNGPYAFDPNDTTNAGMKVDVNLSARLFSFRFSSEGDHAWQMDGYDLDIDHSGGY